MNNNNAAEQVKSNAAAEVRYFILLKHFEKTLFQASNSANRSEKRISDEEIDADIKKIKIETPMLEQKAPMPSAASIASPKFVSAATMAAPISEITDEELLEFTLEFERQHGI